MIKLFSKKHLNEGVILKYIDPILAIPIFIKNNKPS